VGHLSGGEKNLLQLAKLAAGQANLLLLDEPSSHLDTFAQIALEEAIAAYQGAVLMVSHDFYTIANCADTILLVENGGVRPMSARAFRKMIYKKHFSKDYLELELQKKECEPRSSGRWKQATAWKHNGSATNWRTSSDRCADAAAASK
jgi:ATP-binding cassette subfamily F protein 3